MTAAASPLTDWCQHARHNVPKDDEWSSGFIAPIQVASLSAIVCRSFCICLYSSGNFFLVNCYIIRFSISVTHCDKVFDNETAFVKSRRLPFQSIGIKCDSDNASRTVPISHECGLNIHASHAGFKFCWWPSWSLVGAFFVVWSMR